MHERGRDCPAAECRDALTQIRGTTALERAQEQLESAARNYASVAKNVQGTLKLPYVPTRREIKKALKR